jgi:hypothetical protein
MLIRETYYISALALLVILLIWFGYIARASHIFDMVWLYRTPVPVGTQGGVFFIVEITKKLKFTLLCSQHWFPNKMTKIPNPVSWKFQATVGAFAGRAMKKKMHSTFNQCCGSGFSIFCFK